MKSGLKPPEAQPHYSFYNMVDEQDWRKAVVLIHKPVTGLQLFSRQWQRACLLYFPKVAESETEHRFAERGELESHTLASALRLAIASSRLTRSRSEEDLVHAGGIEPTTGNLPSD